MDWYYASCGVVDDENELILAGDPDLIIPPDLTDEDVKVF